MTLPLFTPDGPRRTTSYYTLLGSTYSIECVTPSGCDYGLCINGRRSVKCTNPPGEWTEACTLMPVQMRH